jgi:hypothetical protein
MTKERLLHHATITVFCKPHDNNAAVLCGLDCISPVPTSTLLAQEKKFDAERPNTVYYSMKDIELCMQRTTTDDGAMVIYTIFFKRMSWVNALCRKLTAAMTKEEKEKFLGNPNLLLDADKRLSLRLDKELLMQGKLVITEDGHCYQVKGSVAAYPKSEERVLATVQRILSIHI